MDKTIQFININTTLNTTCRLDDGIWAAYIASNPSQISRNAERPFRDWLPSLLLILATQLFVQPIKINVDHGISEEDFTM